MKRLLGGLACIMLAACIAPSSKNTTAEAIRHEMDAATQKNVKPPRNLATVNDALLPPLIISMPKVDDKPLEPRFDLTVNNTPASQVFTAIVSGTRYNMLVPPGVGGYISLNLKDVTVFEALEAIRELYGYEYKVDGHRIFIQPIELQTRLFQVNYLTATRTGSTALNVQTSSAGGGSTGGTTTGSSGGSSGGGGGNSNVTTTSNSKADFWTELETSLKAIVGDQGGRSLVINSMSGVIVVRAMPDELKNVIAYLKASQISIERQVILEAKIVEVQLNDGFQSGVNWAGFGSAGGSARVSAGVVSPGSSILPKTPGGTAQLISNGVASAVPGASLLSGGAATLFGLAFQTGNFAAMLDYLETQGTVHVLSSPRIATLNNQKAILKVGTDEYFITGFSTTAATTTGAITTPATVTPTYSSIFSGIALDVTPSINENNEVILHVHPSVSQITEKNKLATIGAGNSGTVPMASTAISETDSVVRARDGQIVVIGGLMRQATFDDQSGLPGLSKSIFGQTNKRMEKRELVILLRPTIVDSDKGWADDITRSRDRVSSLTEPAGIKQ